MKFNFNFLLALLLSIIILWCLSTIFTAAKKGEHFLADITPVNGATGMPSVTGIPSVAGMPSVPGSPDDEMKKAIALTSSSPIASPMGSSSLFNQSSLSLCPYANNMQMTEQLLQSNKILLDTNKQLIDLNKVKQSSSSEKPSTNKAPPKDKTPPKDKNPSLTPNQRSQVFK